MRGHTQPMPRRRRATCAAGTRASSWGRMGISEKLSRSEKRRHGSSCSKAISTSSWITTGTQPTSTHSYLVRARVRLGVGTQPTSTPTNLGVGKPRAGFAPSAGPPQLASHWALGGPAGHTERVAECAAHPGALRVKPPGRRAVAARQGGAVVQRGKARRGGAQARAASCGTGTTRRRQDGAVSLRRALARREAVAGRREAELGVCVVLDVLLQRHLT